MKDKEADAQKKIVQINRANMSILIGKCLTGEEIKDKFLCKQLVRKF